MNNPTCQSCRFWDNSRWPSQPVVGQCRRHPPVVPDERNHGERFPITADTDWCGDHEEKKT